MAASRSKPDGGSALGRILRAIFWALLFAFAFGMLVGTLLRRELEKPIRYIGARETAASVAAVRPGDVRNPPSRVLVSRDHEEQVG